MGWGGGDLRGLMLDDHSYFPWMGRGQVEHCGKNEEMKWNHDPELVSCDGELYRTSIVCFLRTTFTPPGTFSVSPFLNDNCTSDFPKWAFNLRKRNFYIN